MRQRGMRSGRRRHDTALPALLLRLLRSKCLRHSPSLRVCCAFFFCPACCTHCNRLIRHVHPFAACLLHSPGTPHLPGMPHLPCLVHSSVLSDFCAARGSHVGPVFPRCHAYPRSLITSLFLFDIVFFGGYAALAAEKNRQLVRVSGGLALSMLRCRADGS